MHDETGVSEEDLSLGRAQRRLLRRIYNGRTVPVVVDGRPFLTYKEARQYLETLAPPDRDRACAEMKEQAAAPGRPT